MNIILGIFFFVSGTIIGSFINVVTLRYHTGRSITRGRSACFSCGKALKWYELIPLISYGALRAHCRSCGSTLSLQYPAVEFGTGILFFGMYLKFFSPFGLSFSSVLYFVLYASVISFLMAILVYDLRHKIIPNAFVYPPILFSLVLLLLHYFEFNDLNALGMFIFAGIGMALPIALLWFFSRGRAMGLGDAKLALALGFLLGPIPALSAFLLSFWFGALVGIFLLFLPAMRRGIQKLFTPHSLSGTRIRFTMKSEIPFAPFLIFGFLLVFFFDINVLEFFI